MRVQFGRGPTAVSKKVPFNFISRNTSNIVKVSDLYQLQVFSFMYDLVNNKLPGSF